MMSALVLENDVLRAEFLPAFGGRVKRLLFKAGGGTDVLVPYEQATFDPLAWPKCGMYPLAPYSNRIRNATLPLGQRVYALPPHPAALPHTLHGCAHTVPWQVVRHDQDSFVLQVDYDGEHWPWTFACRQQFDLTDDGLLLRLTLHNTSPEQAMPAGGGLHPFLSTVGLQEVRYRAGRRWQVAADYLPDGVHTALHGTQSWRRPTGEGSETLDYLSQWDGHLDARYATGTLSLQAGSTLDHLVIFVPASAAYFCAEPVSHLANAFAMPDLPAADTGVRTLAAGEHLTFELRLRWQAADHTAGDAR